MGLAFTIAATVQVGATLFMLVTRRRTRERNTRMRTALRMWIRNGSTFERNEGMYGR
jgi:hypothetical protein